jgi:hypothetical protein
MVLSYDAKLTSTICNGDATDEKSTVAELVRTHPAVASYPKTIDSYGCNGRHPRATPMR